MPRFRRLLLLGACLFLAACAETTGPPTQTATQQRDSSGVTATTDPNALGLSGDLAQDYAISW